MAGFMQNSAGNSPKIPAPPTEVGIRTMTTDVEAIKASGGQPQFVSAPVAQIKEGFKIPAAVWAMGALILLAIVFLIGYYVL